MAMNTREKSAAAMCCNVCGVGFDYRSKLLRHFSSSRHKLLEERCPGMQVSMPSGVIKKTRRCVM